VPSHNIFWVPKKARHIYQVVEFAKAPQTMGMTGQINTVSQRSILSKALLPKLISDEILCRYEQLSGGFREDHRRNMY